MAGTDTALHPGRALARAPGINLAVLVFLLLYAAIAVLQPNYLEPAQFMNFLRRAAPLVILAVGQLFVITAGGFDLSMGALVTLTVLGGSMLIDGDPAQTWWVIGVLYAIGLGIGLLNGAIVSFLKVPSIITTLGMLLVVKGAALLWSGGAPRGYLPDNFRMFGRLVWRDVPVIGTVPLSVIVLAGVVALAAWALHGTVFGRLVLAVGDNPRAAELAGVRVRAVRIACFAISGVAAVTGGILLGGFAGVSTNVGDGLELQAIAACVIGGAMLLGGRGTVVGAVAGALALYALFTLLNLMGLPQEFRQAVQGVILIAAVALSVRRRREGG